MKRVVKTSVLILLILLIFIGISLIVERKSSYEKNEMFMREAAKDNIDVFILGSSHVINGINPVKIFDEHGITAYNLGGYGSVLMSSYWQLMLALDQCMPKLVIVDTYMLENDVRFVDDAESNVTSEELHMNIDRFPLNKTKLSALRDMFYEKDNIYSYIFDYIIYHDRWKDLEANDFLRVTGKGEINRLMGADLKYELHSAEYVYPEYQWGFLDHNTVGTIYFRRIIEECQDRGIDVVAVTVPYMAMQEGQDAAHTAELIAQEYGVPFVNMLEMPGLVDYNLDFADAGHLNALGSEKVTDYLGRWLDDNTSLTDHRNDDRYNVWKECAEDYAYDLSEMSRDNPDIYSQLLMLQIGQVEDTVVCSIKGDAIAYYDPIIIRQLKALGAGDALDEAVNDRSPYFFVLDHGVVTEINGFGEAIDINTSQGKITYQSVSDIYRIMYLDGDEDVNYLYDDEHAYTDVQLLFIENDSVRSHQFYSNDHFPYEYDKE